MVQNKNDLEQQLAQQRRELESLKKEREALEERRARVSELARLKNEKEREIKRLSKIKVPTVAQEKRKQKVQRGLSKTVGFLKKAEQIAVTGTRNLIREEEKLRKNPQFKAATKEIGKGFTTLFISPKAKRKIKGKTIKKRKPRARPKRGNAVGFFIDTSGRTRRVR